MALALGLLGVYQEEQDLLYRQLKEVLLDRPILVRWTHVFYSTSNYSLYQTYRDVPKLTRCAACVRTNDLYLI